VSEIRSPKKGNAQTSPLAGQATPA